MDTSDGPRESEFELQKSFTSSLSQFFDLGADKVQVAIIANGPKTEILNGLSPNITQSILDFNIKRLRQKGRGRNLAKAFETIGEVLRSGRQSIPRLVIVYSFGLPSSNQMDMKIAAQKLHNQGVIVLAIGIDVDENEPQLRAIVSRSQDLFTYSHARELENEVSVFAGYIVSRAGNVIAETIDPTSRTH